MVCQSNSLFLNSSIKTKKKRFDWIAHWIELGHFGDTLVGPADWRNLSYYLGRGICGWRITVSIKRNGQGRMDRMKMPFFGGKYKRELEKICFQQNWMETTVCNNRWLPPLLKAFCRMKKVFQKYVNSNFLKSEPEEIENLFLTN